MGTAGGNAREAGLKRGLDERTSLESRARRVNEAHTGHPEVNLSLKLRKLRRLMRT